MDDEKEDIGDILEKVDSLRKVMDVMLQAMTRLKESTGKRKESTEKRFKVLELSIAGLVERTENLEKAFRDTFTKAQDNLQVFLDKASDNSEKEDSEADTDSETDSDIGETPAVEVVG